MGELSWRSHPFREEAPRSWGIAAGILGLCLLLALAFGGWFWGALALPFLLLSLGRYFLPTEYRLGDDGVEVRYLGSRRLRPWSDFRALYAHRMGVHLSPFERPSGMDPFRGLFLRFPPGRGEEVLAFCRERVR